jgi:hypothetical protein
MTSERQDPAGEWSSRRHPVEEDMRFQRRSWRIQRIGWAGMVLLLLLALGGLFSVGPLSTTTAVSPDGRLAATADRFLRNGARTSLRITLPPTSGETELRVSGGFLERFTVDGVQPQPLRATSSAQALSLVFASPPGMAPLAVFFTVRPHAIGPSRTRFSMGDGATANLSQLVYP